MKYSTYRLLLFVCLMCIAVASCKKKKEGIEGLPTITQEGKGTFGCMVNGQLFLPKGSAIGGNVQQSYYQNVDDTLYFLATGSHQTNNGVLSVTVETEGIQLETGMTIPLSDKINGSGLGIYRDYQDLHFKDFETNKTIRGELKISRFDLSNQIVSGTFWFDAVTEQGEKMEVREGRFDMRFIR